MVTYIRAALVGASAAIAVALLAWAVGWGPHVIHHTFPPPPSEFSGGEHGSVSVTFGPVSETALQVPRFTQGAALLAFLTGVAWTIKRARFRKAHQA